MGVFLFGCHAGARKDAAPEVARFYGRWLSKNVRVNVDRAGVNPRSGLFEVDAALQADSLEPGRDSGYRIVARTLFYRGGRDRTVDESAWSELVIEPGKPVAYASTSLQPADDFVIEVGYPEEVGLR